MDELLQTLSIAMPVRGGDSCGAVAMGYSFFEIWKTPEKGGRTLCASVCVYLRARVCQDGSI